MTRIGTIAAVLACACFACSGCLRTNAQGDARNTNGPGSTNEQPHNTSGPGAKATGGVGLYGSQSWSPERPAIGFGPLEPEQVRSAGSSTDQPGTSGNAPGTGNNGWGGPSDRSVGVSGNSNTVWTQ